MNGRPLIEYATQGARIMCTTIIIRWCFGCCIRYVGWVVAMCGLAQLTQTIVQFFGEIVGALPRMVVVLVIALLLPMDWRSLMPLAVVWAVLSAGRLMKPVQLPLVLVEHVS